MSANVVDLGSLPPGTRAKLIDIVAGRGLRERLLQMGLVPGTVIEVVQRFGGIIVIRFRNTTLTVSRGIAKKIIVSIEPS